MRFATPENLLLFFLVLALAGFYLWAINRKKKLLERFGDVFLIMKNAPYISFARQGGKAAMILAGMIFLTLTLSRLQCGTHMEMMKRQGIDIIIAIDVSNSMLAEDIKPNRITKASQEVRGILDRLSGDRVGLIAFAGEAFIQCPLTLDYSAAEIFLDVIDIGLVQRQGTAIGDAVRKAVDGFGTQEKKHKALILLTDGEDQDTDPIAAAELARENGVKVFTVGIGSAMGEPIPVLNRKGEKVGYKKDDNGEVVVTKLDEVTLQKIAQITGGKYYRATAGEMELDRVYEEINKMEKKELEGRMLMQYEDRFQYVLILALLFIIIEFFVSERSRKKNKMVTE